MGVGITLAHRVKVFLFTTFEPKATLNPDESGAKQSPQRTQRGRDFLELWKARKMGFRGEAKTHIRPIRTIRG
jgi:hypothetical protein